VAHCTSNCFRPGGNWHSLDFRIAASRDPKTQDEDEAGLGRLELRENKQTE